jgi:F-type H+-transporting ATPase subunit 8
MPQLVPFYFINQVTFAFTSLIVILYILSKYVLPRFVRLFVSRMFISKL